MEQPPPPTKQPPAQTEPPPAPPPQLQKIEDQVGSAVDQLGARLQKKLGTVEDQMDERLDALNWSFARMWVRPVCVGLAICVGVSLPVWGYAAWLAYSIGSQREKLDALKLDIAQQQATVRELEQETWGVGYQESENGRFLVLPEGSKRNWQVGGKPAVKLPDK